MRLRGRKNRHSWKSATGKTGDRAKWKFRGDEARYEMDFVEKNLQLKKSVHLAGRICPIFCYRAILRPAKIQTALPFYPLGLPIWSADRPSQCVGKTAIGRSIFFTGDIPCKTLFFNRYFERVICY